MNTSLHNNSQKAIESQARFAVIPDRLDEDDAIPSVFNKLASSIFPAKYISSSVCEYARLDFEYVEEFDDSLRPISPQLVTRGDMCNTVIKTECSSHSLPTEKISCIVDFLSITFSLCPGSLEEDFLPPELRVENFITEFVKLVPNLSWGVPKNGHYGYKYSIHLLRLGQHVGFVDYGGNQDTCYMSLSGQGCVGVDMAKLKDYLEKLPKVKITRVDMAHDDLDGTVGVVKYADMYKSGAFNVHGMKPGVRWLDDFDSGEGKTLYVGHKKNGKEACIYEKGKQLGDEKSPWVRVEGRLTSVDRVIPFDVMINPEQYLAKLYPPFSMLSAIHAQVVIIKKHVKIALDVLTESCRVAYGPLINYMRGIGYKDAKIVNELIGKGTPRRLLIPVCQLENSIPF